MAKYVCPVCGYIHEGDEPPKECPVCHVSGDKFTKFAELIGSDLESNMTSSTKKNLAWIVDCEFGATKGKFDLAACAKKNNLDAIHDTVHEMARDALLQFHQRNIQFKQYTENKQIN